MADLGDVQSRRRTAEDGDGVVSVAQRERSVQEGGEEEDEFYQQSSLLDFDSDSFSPANDSSNPQFFDDYTSCFDFGYEEDHDCEYEESNRFFFGAEEDAEQMSFVTDLFGSRRVPVVEDPIWEMESGSMAASPLALGGLRVVGVDSESDSDEFEINSGFIDHDEDGIYASVETRVDNHHSNDIGVEEFEWEEVGDRILFDERENLNSVINTIEEISVSSSEEGTAHLGNDEEGDDERNAEWEVLLAMNNIERTLDLDIMEENSGVETEALHVGVPEDYIVPVDFNALFGLLADNETAPKGSPPAAKSTVENLPSVVLTNKEVLEKKVVICAVCKDELTVGEKVTTMPCHHMYHGGCILPWLSIRNTCPVCRYELPTDDVNYEKRKGERDSHGAGILMDDEFPLRYNFEVLQL